MLMKIFKNYTFLSNEEFGALFKMSIQYLENNSINENEFKKEYVMFFYIHLKKELDFMIKERNRKKKYYERRKINNEN